MPDALNEWTDETNHRDITVPRFYFYAMPDKEETVKQGRPIFKDVEFVEIITPGDQLNRPKVPVKDEHRRRWPVHYKQWKAGETEQHVGTPLIEWPGITRSMCEELKHFRIYTVEELANVSDSNIKNLGPILSLRQKAQDYIALAKKTAPLAKVRAELEKRDNLIETLQRQVAELAADLASTRQAHK